MRAPSDTLRFWLDVRALALAIVAISIMLALALPSGSSAASCVGTSCGVPICYEPTVRLRPDLTRTVTVQCRNATAAKLVTPPAHSDVSNVRVDYSGLRFDARPHDGAPRHDEAVFELKGHDGTIELRVKIVVVPRSENSAPICWGDSVSKRTDGSGPVHLFLHPYCHDPDGDDFVMEGGPPGVHPESPKRVAAGDSVSNWNYTTKTFSGEETTTVWATDVLGARSADAQLKVTVGPLDRPPECTPNGYSWAEVLAVNMRPGKVRRFGLVCTDPDADPFVSRLTDLPQRGALATVEGPPQYGFWGVERFTDATYVPLKDDLEPDPFSYGATGVRGDGPPRRMAMVPRKLPYNSGGGCGWSPANVVSPGPGLLWAHCNDNEGDDPIVEVITQPRHGTLGPTVVTTGLYGWNDITIPYVPELGYEGYDCVEIKVSDGHGTTFKMTIDIWVKAPVDLPDLPEVPDLPELPDPPVEPELPDPPVPLEESPPPEETAPAEETAPPEPEETAPRKDTSSSETTPDRPHAPPWPVTTPPLEDVAPTEATEAPAPPDLVPPPADETSTEVPASPNHTRPAPSTYVSPDSIAPPKDEPVDPPIPVVPPPPAATLDPGQSARAVAKRILGTKSVKLVRRAGGVNVWARSKLSRRDLLRTGHAPGIVVICRSSCRVNSSVQLEAGSKAIRSSRQRTATAVMPEQPHVLALALGDADRAILGRLRKPLARFRLSIRADGATATSFKRAIPVRG